MKSVRNACHLQPNALEITVGDQIEQLDQIVHCTDGREYFSKTHITGGMKTLLTRGIARLAGKSNDTVFHLKQAMGGGKTHLMVGFGLLAKDPEISATHPQRKELDERKVQYQQDFQATVLNVFDRVLFPGSIGELSILWERAGKNGQRWNRPNGNWQNRCNKKLTIWRWKPTEMVAGKGVSVLYRSGLSGNWLARTADPHPYHQQRIRDGCPPGSCSLRKAV